MNARRDNQVRYLVTFSDGGSGMRWYDDPLAEDTVVNDGPAAYAVAHVEQPKFPGGLGRAWCELLDE